NQNVSWKVYIGVRGNEGVEGVMMARFLEVPLKERIAVQRAVEGSEDIVGQYGPFVTVVEKGFPSVVPASWFQERIIDKAPGFEIEADLPVRNGQAVHQSRQNSAGEKIRQAVVQSG